jgi:hypothetical protein
MRIATLITIATLSLILAYTGVIRGFGLLDFLVSAILISIAIYVVIRYSLPIVLGVEQKPLVKLDIRYIHYLYLAILYSLTLTFLGYIVDIFMTFFFKRTVLIYMVSAAIPIITVYTISKFFGFKGLRIALTVSIIVLGILHILGYVEEVGML